ncbi:MAG: MBL fold metallo-hydrolase [Oscillospiraceae bacterium]|nr:MBL fold metallo-hydrolase [Oscillospiraceae bacterium]
MRAFSKTMGYYVIKEIYPWLYSIRDHDVFCYVLVGGQRAVLFDTAYGIADLHSAVRSVTDKPYDVILGHGHLDHVNGAYQFDKVYMHEGDFDLCRLHTSRPYRENLVKAFAGTNTDAPPEFDREAYLASGEPNLEKLEIGRVFDLGGLSIEIVDMIAHTQGSIGLLVREKRVLLVSDAANGHVWLFTEETLPLKDYVEMLERTYSSVPFDTFFIGHDDAPLPKSDFVKYISAAKAVSMEKSVPYETAYLPELKPYIFSLDGVDVIFSEKKLGGLRQD